ncbi:hypothetical protein [Limosilactobacillus vaginalis]|uniref:hypothetical protein n=1 Tax=Limosilactobacillus vaginalis TaxID=1633 RepID=UPI00373550DC
MNYLMESKAFYASIELNQLSTGQIALWHALLDINNQVQWQEWFSVPNIVLQLHTGLSVQGINKSRNVLKQLGYIDFKTSGNRKATKYHLLTLLSTNSSSNSSNNSSSNSSKNGSNNSSSNSSTLNKQNKTNNSDKSQATRHHTQQKFADDSVEMQLAMYLFSKIKENNPDHKKLTDSQRQKWADSIRLMIERDKRTPQQIQNMIDWCQADDFWKQNILSTAKLRKQYDTMAPKANAQWQSNQQRKRVYS